MFTRIAWADKKHTRLLYRGDKIKFQNGFGAWQNHVYDCVYEPISKQVVSVTARPGVID